MNFKRLVPQFCVLLLFCVSCIQSNASAQNRLKASDSVRLILSEVKNADGDFDRKYDLLSKAISISTRVKDTISIILSYQKMGDVLWYKGLFGRAEDYYLKSLYLAKKNKYPQEHAYALYSVGWVECVQKSRINRIGLLREASSIYEDLKDSTGILLVTNAIAGVYGNYGEKFKKEIYLDSSILFLKKAINMCSSNPRFTKKLPHFRSNLAEHYYGKKEYALALKNVDSSLLVNTRDNDLNTFLFSMITKAKILAATNQVDKAIQLLSAHMDEIYSHGESQKILESNRFLYQFYKQKGDFKNALKYYEIFLEKEQQNTEELLTAKYEEAENNEKLFRTEKRIAQLVKQKELFSLKEKQRNNLLYVAGFIFVLVVLFLFVIIRRNRRINVLNSSISKQKELLEEKHVEITDSINYAKRIQDAILPSSALMNDYLKNGFVYYNPKDIVSGDFYWMEKVDSAVYFAVADCTGHGVPGAMVSVVCANALSKALLEENVRETGSLLDRTRELVVQSFSNDSQDVKDGMDISLCRLEGNTLQWSGANNPLWIIRNQSQTIEEYKADKQPIGKSDQNKPFTSHTIQLERGDTLYLLSDGYADQFGGEKGKKFMYKPLKELLISLVTFPMDKQKNLLDERFQTWKGNLDQVDDVCLIGVKI
jgi:serine phosphatase RsbU (regulator of sigma subunit)